MTTVSYISAQLSPPDARKPDFSRSSNFSQIPSNKNFGLMAWPI